MANVEKRDGRVWFEMSWLMERLLDAVPEGGVLAWHKILEAAAEEMGDVEASAWLRRRIDGAQH